MTSFTDTAWDLDADRGDDWRKRARCAAFDAEIWFPVGDGGNLVVRELHALEICRSCPVRRDCGRWAVENGVTDGVWGMHQHQLRQLVAEQGTAKPRTHGLVGECGRGHDRNAANTYVHPLTGERWCKVCQQISRRARLGVGPGRGSASRSKTHCPYGHVYDEENTYFAPAGKRQCRVCRRARHALARQAVAV